MTATAMTATMAMIHPDDESSTEIGSEATSAINKETFTANSVHAVGRFFEDGSWPQRGGNGIGRRRVDLGVSNANQGTVYWRPGCPFCSLLRAVLPSRHGDGLSFYRGPLAPVRNDPVAQQLFDTFDNRLPERADELILHDEVVAMDDVTYAVAFDLGRSLMLRETAIALAVADHRRAARLAAHTRGQLHGLTDHKLAQIGRASCRERV